MTDRFDLEQNIMQCWNVTDDIQLYLDMHDKMDEDQRMNYLIGLKQMYQMKFERCWDSFEQCVRTRQI
jgi:hypothetical protein